MKINTYYLLQTTIHRKFGLGIDTARSSEWYNSVNMYSLERRYMRHSFYTNMDGYFVKTGDNMAAYYLWKQFDFTFLFINITELIELRFP